MKKQQWRKSERRRLEKPVFLVVLGNENSDIVFLNWNRECKRVKKQASNFCCFLVAMCDGKWNEMRESSVYCFCLSEGREKV